MKSEDLQYPILSNAPKKMQQKKGKKYVEYKLKNLENVLDNYDNLKSYHDIKDENGRNI